MPERPRPRARDAQTRAAQRVGARDLRVARHPVVRVRRALLRGEEREDGGCGLKGVETRGGEKSAVGFI